MIRLNKSVRLYEWGEGTNTLNQVWNQIGDGKIVSTRLKQGKTTMTVELKGAFSKRNPRDTSIKVAQQGEGMTARSDKWGEVAIGYLRAVETKGAKSVVVIEIETAAKVARK